MIYILRGRRVDGLIIAPAQDNRNLELLKRFKKEKFPFVLIDRYYKGEKFNAVVTNDEEMAYQAVKYLINLGQRRIGYISGPPLVSTSQNRFSGYKRALLESSSNPCHCLSKQGKELVKGDSFGEKDGYKAMKEFLKMKEIPTAILAVNDPVAIGAFRAINEKGLKVPDDISLVGFANLSSASLIGLTTIDQPKSELGKIACQRLLKIIENNNTPPRKIILKSKFLIRSSTTSLTNL